MISQIKSYYTFGCTILARAYISYNKSRKIAVNRCNSVWHYGITLYCQHCWQ